MDECLKINQERWNELVPIHEKSKFYQLEEFKKGKIVLNPLEIRELGDVTGKSLLHLQCHFGMDTLSWARLGANVTGADFSPKAITLAKQLSQELNIPARFIESDIFDLPQHLDEKFDMVFTSYGVLSWTRDLQKWGEIISRFLKPGGIFYIVEFHPFSYVFDDTADRLTVSNHYFTDGSPILWKGNKSYADDSTLKTDRHYEWMYTISGVVNGLISNGLKILFLNEYPFSVYKQLPFMEYNDKQEYWELKEKIPLLFSIKAVKEE